jgi:hypothetical protein
MDIVTLGLIVIATWFSLLVVVVAMCKAAAFGDASGEPARAGATESAGATTYLTAGERSPIFDRPALG